jgi:hypothetical protein
VNLTGAQVRARAFRPYAPAAQVESVRFGRSAAGQRSSPSIWGCSFALSTFSKRGTGSPVTPAYQSANAAALVYLADEEEHGLGFPRGIEKTLARVIASPLGHAPDTAADAEGARTAGG